MFLSRFALQLVGGLLFLIIGSHHLAKADSRSNCTSILVEQVVLSCNESDCIDGDPYEHVNLEFDLYRCEQQIPKNLRRRRQNVESHHHPFLIVGCGGPAAKDDYSMFAQEMVQRGYSGVAVPEKFINPIPGSPAIVNGVTPVDLKRVIQYVKTKTEMNVNETVLLGHSFGGAQVMFALNGVCHPGFCASPDSFSSTDYVKVDLPEEVIAGGTFGSPAIQVRGGPGDTHPDHNLFNAGNPLFIFFGDGDHNVVDSCGAPCFDKLNYLYTYDEMIQDKFLAVGENLDHNSIANRILSTRSTFRNSTLPRNLQVSRVADGFDQWIQYLVHDKDEDFCQETLTIPLMKNESDHNVCMFDIEDSGDGNLTSSEASITSSLATSFTVMSSAVSALLWSAFF